MSVNTETPKKKPSVLISFSVIILLVALLGLVIAAGGNIIPVLVIITSYLVVIGQFCGYTWKELIDAMVEKCTGLIETLLIMYAIGIFIGVMMYSGTIPTLIYYLINIINPNFMIVLSFVIPAIVAVIIGTSWGTAGTVGIIMISIATGMGISLPMVAGAVISGSHVGQLLSPMSDTSNLAANLAKVDTPSMIKRMAFYSVPVVIIATVLYLFLGFTSGSSEVSLDAANQIRAEIASMFNVNPIAILPMLLVFVMTLKQQPVVKSLLSASFLGLIFGVILNGFDPLYGIEVMYSGFNLGKIPGVDPAAYSEVFNNLLNRGGMDSMNSSALLAIIATCLGAVIAKVQVVNVIVETVFAKVKSRFGLTTSVVAVTAMMDACTSSTFLAMLLACEFFREKFHLAGLSDSDLVASAMSVGSQFIAIVPWSDTAIYMAGITGVATFASLPYTFFCWGCAVMMILLSIPGIGFARKSQTAETIQA